MKRLLLLLFLLIHGSIITNAQMYTLGSCTGPGTGNWQSLGPFTSTPGTDENQGRIISVWVDPTDDNHILAGANCGGLWKSTNGGTTWKNLTDGTGSNAIFGMEGVNSIAVNPVHPNIIYASLISDGVQNKKGDTYHLGLVYSTDGGNSWQLDNTFISLTGTGAQNVIKIGYAPGTENLYALSENKIFYLENSSPYTYWLDINPNTDLSWQDFQFSNVTTGKVVFSTSAYAGNAHLYSWTPAGGWSNINMATAGSYTIDNIPAFTLTATDVAIMKVSAHTGSTPYTLLVKTPIGSYSPTVDNTNFPNSATQFQVSQGNAGIIYASNYGGFYWNSHYTYPAIVLQSIDSGKNFSVYDSVGHPDGRCIYVYNSTNTSDGLNDEVFLGTDGGIRKKAAGDIHFQSITGSGLTIGQFFGFGNTEVDEDYMTGGQQDNGGFVYNKHSTTPWAHLADGDGYNAKFKGVDSKDAIGEDNGTATGTAPWSLYGFQFTSPTIITSFSVPTPLDDAVSNINRPQHSDLADNVYIGYSHIWKMATGTTTWAKAFVADPIDVYSLPGEIVVDFFIDDNHPNIAYISYSGSSLKLFYSSNANDPISPAWIDITPSLCGPPNNFIINSIAVDPKNSNRVFVGFGSLYEGRLGTNPESMINRVWTQIMPEAPGRIYQPGLPPYR